MSQKNVHLSFLLQLKAVWTDLFNFLVHHTLKIVTCKCIHNLPPHLSYIATLPENTLSVVGRHIVFLWVAGWSWMMWETDDWRIPVLLEISHTGWHVCDTPCWLNMRSPSWLHSPQYTQFVVCRSLYACQMSQCHKLILAASEDFACSITYLEILSAISVLCIF